MDAFSTRAREVRFASGYCRHAGKSACRLGLRRKGFGTLGERHATFVEASKMMVTAQKTRGAAPDSTCAAHASYGY
jgi:hypothetical protein